MTQSNLLRFRACLPQRVEIVHTVCFPAGWHGGKCLYGAYVVTKTIGTKGWKAFDGEWPFITGPKAPFWLPDNKPPTQSSTHWLEAVDA